MRSTKNQETSRFKQMRDLIETATNFCDKELPEAQGFAAALFFSGLQFPSGHPGGSLQGQRFGYAIVPEKEYNASSSDKRYQLVEFTEEHSQGVIRETSAVEEKNSVPKYDWIWHSSYYISLTPNGEYQFLAKDILPVELDMKLTDILNITQLQPVQSPKSV